MKIIAGLFSGLITAILLASLVAPAFQNVCADAQDMPPGHFTRMSLPATQITWTSEDQMNKYFVSQFIASRGFGFDRMWTPPMEINDAMRLILTPKTAANGMASNLVSTYKIDKLELIGIAKHETPVAFVKARHASSSANAKTRGLTDFEEKALHDLVVSNDVSVQTEKGSLVVVGAVRAQSECLECHPGSKTGDLLGAFSYHLSPVDLSNDESSVRFPH